MQIYKNDKEDPLTYTAETIEGFIAHCKNRVLINEELLRSLINDREKSERVAGFSTEKSEYKKNENDLNDFVKRKFHLLETETTSVYFDEMKKRFLECVSAYDMALCAIYSLGDKDIINSLSKMKYISVLVDKKQHDYHVQGNNKLYDALIKRDGLPSNKLSSIETYNNEKDCPGEPYEKLSAFKVVDIDQIKNYESFHTKFFVFCNVREILAEDCRGVRW
ncbi:hypothetical protein [Elstera litoralis]|uniref:hypothetical protein n=1 Tax=Elstera litoralis TaxID=552518 RepID=UPI0012EDF3F8|nr:hypothetical protein [Elstera litoralis]